MKNHPSISARVCVTSATLVVALALLACRAPVDPSKTVSVDRKSQPASSPTSTPEAERSMIALIKDLPFMDKEESAGMLRAWRQVPNNDRYRAAQRGDFEHPVMTQEYGEMAGAFGLASFIVDKTIAGLERFSLVIFIERQRKRYDVYWIYRNMDLSKYNMSRASGDVMVEEAQADGTTRVCEIQWSRKEKRWACNAL